MNAHINCFKITSHFESVKQINMQKLAKLNFELFKKSSKVIKCFINLPLHL